MISCFYVIQLQSKITDINSLFYVLALLKNKTATCATPVFYKTALYN